MAASKKMSKKVLEVLEREHKGEAIEFELRGEVFRCANPVPGMVVMLIGEVTDEALDPSERLRIFGKIGKGVVHEEDVSRFEAHLLGSKPVMDLEQIIGVYQEVLALAMGNPTEG